MPGPNIQRREASKSEVVICCQLQGARAELSAPESRKAERCSVCSGKVRSWKSEVGSRKTEVRHWKSESGKSEIGSRKPDFGRQDQELEVASPKLEVTSQKSEGSGSWKSEVGKLEIGSCKVGSRKVGSWDIVSEEVGSRMSEVRNRVSGIRIRKLEVGRWTPRSRR